MVSFLYESCTNANYCAVIFQNGRNAQLLQQTYYLAELATHYCVVMFQSGRNAQLLQQTYYLAERATHYCVVMFQSGRNAQVLQQTYYLAERAVSLNSTDANYVTELGYQLLMQGKNRDAMKCYRNAMKLDETSVSALTGQTYAIVVCINQRKYYPQHFSFCGSAPSNCKQIL